MIRSRVLILPSRAIAVALFVLAACAGCGSQPSTSATPAPNPSAAAAPAASGASTGRVVGTAPILNGVPSIVLLQPEKAGDAKGVGQAPVMDQVQMTFTPDLLIVRTGQPVEFRNNDEPLHNINVKEDATKAQAFNIALPPGGVYRFTFKRDGFYNVTCDVHPAMGASIVAASTPYAIATDTAGAFAFNDVPSGAYTAVALVGARRLERPIQVGGADTQVAFQ